jgi:hypothetical protein
LSSGKCAEFLLSSLKQIASRMNVNYNMMSEVAVREGERRGRGGRRGGRGGRRGGGGEKGGNSQGICLTTLISTQFLLCNITYKTQLLPT